MEKVKFMVEAPKEFAEELNGVVELCLRGKAKRFRKFIKANIVYENDKSEQLEQFFNKVMNVAQKTEYSVKQINQAVGNMEGLVNKADKMLNSAKNLGWANLIVSFGNLCVTAAGFIEISGQIDRVSAELSKVARDISGIKEHQAILDKEKIKAIFNKYKNILNKEKNGENVHLDEYYDIVNEMSLTIESVYECFVKDVGHREVYLNAISTLMPIYSTALTKFDKSHYFKYKCEHISRNDYLKKFDLFSNFEFLNALQEYLYLEVDDVKTTRDAFELAFSYIIKIKEGYSTIYENYRVISAFDNEEQYRTFQNKINDHFEKGINEELQNSNSELSEYISNELKNFSYSEVLERVAYN